MSKIDHRAYQELMRSIDTLLEHSIIGPLQAKNMKKRINLHVNSQQHTFVGRPSRNILRDEEMEDTPFSVKIFTDSFSKDKDSD